MTEFAKPSEQSARSDGAPFGKRYQETVPPFNPEQKARAANDSELVQEMIKQSDDSQENLEYYIEILKDQNGELNYVQMEDLKKIYDFGKRDESKSIAEYLEEDVTHQQEMQRILIDALGEQSSGSKKLQGKPIEEILQAKIDGVIERMKGADDEIERVGGITESTRKQYEELITQKNRLDETLIWVKGFREFRQGDSSTIPESDTDYGISMEQMPAGKTKEQIEAEESKKRRVEEEYQKRVNEYWEQKRQAEQQRREENERQQQARQKAEAERQERIRAQREQVINAARNTTKQEQAEEEEMGM